MKKLTLTFSVLLIAGGCAQLKEAPKDKAQRLAQEYLMVDTHVDIPYRLYERMEDISVRTESGDYDYVRGKEGGLDVPFMSIYVPSDMEDNGATERADALINMVEGFVTDHPDKFAHAFSVADVRKNFEKGLVSLPMGLENGSPIDHKIENIRHFAERGIRYITLAHAKSNHLSNAAYDEERPWENGLSPFGEEVIAEMNRYGVMVDMSHLSDDAAHRVLDITAAPVVASHSSCRAFTPGFERNISDTLIRRVKENNGVIMIAFGSGFLTEEYQKAETESWGVISDVFEKNGWKFGDPEATAYIEEYRKQNPLARATVKDVVDHIEHVIKIAGIDHVGFGSDFDGVGDSLPEDLRSVAQMPNIIEELIIRGYSDDDIRKICGENVLRVWSDNEKVSQELQAEAMSS